MKILETLSTKINASEGITKRLKNLLVVTADLWFRLFGKYNYRNLERESGKKRDERTFSRLYGCDCGVIDRITRELVEEKVADQDVFLAIDTTFIPKAGRKTEGLGKFYNPVTGKANRGLCLSLISVVFKDPNGQMQALPLRTDQVFNLAPAKDKSEVPKQPPVSGTKPARENRHIRSLTAILESMKRLKIRYIVGDGGYANTEFIQAAEAVGLHVVSRLRSDAGLRFLFTGVRSSKRGRPPQINRRDKWSDLSARERLLTRVEGAGLSEEWEVRSGIVDWEHLKRKIRVVWLRPKNQKSEGITLFSTDLEQSPAEIVHMYQSRFQIEFLFRDAKQHLGLKDCQSLKQQKQEFHFKWVFLMLALGKLEILSTGCSRISFKKLKTIHFGNKILSKLFQISPELAIAFNKDSELANILAHNLLVS